MGLAAWAALAGGAKGAEKGIDVAVERENARIDEQRQIAMERLKDKLATRREETGREFQAAQNDLNRQVQRDVVGMQQEGATDRTRMTTDTTRDVARLSQDMTTARQAADQAWQSAENALDRAQKDRLDRLARKAKENAKLQERFEPRTLSVREAGEMGLDIETEKPAIFDTRDGSWYLQEGNRYVLPGAEPIIPGAHITDPNPKRQAEKRARAYGQALEYLYENPETYSTFRDTFGWLPADFFAGQGYTARSSSSSSSETTAKER